MRAVSLFTGAGGMDLGFERAGIEAVLQCDLFDASHLTDISDKERRDLTRYGQALRGVLERHWPEVERVNDVRNVTAASLHDSRDGRLCARGERDRPRGDGEDKGTWQHREQQHDFGVDLVHFGSPCQDLSVAGKQSGFVEGGRSHLFFEGVRVIRELRPRFAIWENVVGALSSNGGRDFAAVLAALADAGAVDIAWRVLDARWFGVPQRRRRVFVVADFGGERAAEVLFEPEGGAGLVEARGATGEGVALAPALRASGVGVERIGDTRGQDPLVVAPTLREQVPMAIRTAQTGSNGWGVGVDEQAYTLDGAQGQAVISPAVTSKWANGSGGPSGDEAQNLTLAPAGVRRLTPREAERLMGWPDDWTRWTADGSEVSDSLRYRMVGNGVAAPVAEWIGRRLVRAIRESEQGESA